jgi:pimeloyl-ACP methyl ester carboxylesterase
MVFFKTMFQEPTRTLGSKIRIQDPLQRRKVVKSSTLGTSIIAPSTNFTIVEQTETFKEKISVKPNIEAPDGTNLFYQDWGKGNPILFLAPWALNSNWWEYQIPFLTEEGFRCIAYDRRGHGRSDRPGKGYEFDTLADDLAAVIKQLNLSKVTVVAHAMGCGEIVRYFSRKGAGAVSRVVLISTVTPLIFQTPENPSGPDKQSLESTRSGLSRDRPNWLSGGGSAFFGPKNSVSTELMEWGTRQILQSSLNAMLHLHRVYTATDFHSELNKITVPTLIIHGDADVFSPLESTGRRTAALIKGSQLKVYKNAAHGLTVTHMDQLNTDLLAFAKS